MKITIQEFHRDECSLRIETSEQSTWSVVPVLFLRTLIGRDDILAGDVFEFELGTMVRTRKTIISRTIIRRNYLD
jgi:hypothetical protein